MPELPEVETIVSGLQKELIGLHIKELQVLRPQILEHTDILKLNQYLLGQNITQVKRRGKYILISFNNGCKLTTHLRMSGCYILFNTIEALTAYTRLCFNLSQHKQLQYQDKRALGRIRLYLPGERLTALEGLGVEPLGDGFSVDYLMHQMKRHRREIKPLLLDQRFIAGIGNIYASEILFAAHISPVRISNALKPTEVKRLFQAVRHILTQAIASRGTHISDYLDSAGKTGNFFKLLKVYGLEGEYCRRCGAKIRRIVQQQRSSFYCPGCQH